MIDGDANILGALALAAMSTSLTASARCWD